MPSRKAQICGFTDALTPPSCGRKCTRPLLERVHFGHENLTKPNAPALWKDRGGILPQSATPASSCIWSACLCLQGIPLRIPLFWKSGQEQLHGVTW